MVILLLSIKIVPETGQVNKVSEMPEQAKYSTFSQNALGACKLVQSDGDGENLPLGISA